MSLSIRFSIRDKVDQSTLKYDDIIIMASHHDGCCFGSFVTDVVLPSRQGVKNGHFNFYEFNIIFSKDKIDEFVKELETLYKVVKVATEGNRILKTYTYQLFQNDVLFLVMNVVVSNRIPNSSLTTDTLLYNGTSIFFEKRFWEMAKNHQTSLSENFFLKIFDNEERTTAYIRDSPYDYLIRHLKSGWKIQTDSGTEIESPIDFSKESIKKFVIRIFLEEYVDVCSYQKALKMKKLEKEPKNESNIKNLDPKQVIDVLVGHMVEMVYSFYKYDRTLLDKSYQNFRTEFIKYFPKFDLNEIDNYGEMLSAKCSKPFKNCDARICMVDDLRSIMYEDKILGTKSGRFEYITLVMIGINFSVDDSIVKIM